MADREKVLKGLECCCQMNGNVCRTECPYRDECIENECVGTAHLCANALELLKNEPLPVLNVRKCGIYFGDCPHCGKRVTKKNTSYCPYCGKRVKWE